MAVIGGQLFTELIDITSDVAALDGTGMWVVLMPFAGTPICARFATTRPVTPSTFATTRWPGVAADPAQWSTSMSQATFEQGVNDIRRRIADGSVYQVNLTRRCATPLPANADVIALGASLAAGNPAPFQATFRLVERDIHVASASPERFLERSGNQIWSSPIKGTAATTAAMTPKDTAENVMIVDLVRNDLGRVCEWGTVAVPSLCAVEQHPGLVHLVSTVSGTLRADVTWPEILAATFPPGSVTGAPKLAALDTISELEPVPRGPYCGALGWVDADRQRAALNVAIRTFWFEDGLLCFGTGGGITWDSNPTAEWRETELKAHNLLAIAARTDGRLTG